MTDQDFNKLTTKQKNVLYNIELAKLIKRYNVIEKEMSNCDKKTHYLVLIKTDIRTLYFEREKLNKGD